MTHTIIRTRRGRHYAHELTTGRKASGSSSHEALRLVLASDAVPSFEVRFYGRQRDVLDGQGIFYNEG